MRSAAASLLALLALSLGAQEKLAETIEVHVVSIDVVVTDRTGHPVPGLTKNDFEILENGKPQTITNFYEVKPPAAEELSVTNVPPAPVPQAAMAPAAPSVPQQTASVPDDVRARRYVFVVDNYSMQPAQRNSALAALQKFVDHRMRPGDEAALIVWQRRIEMVTPLTADRAEIKRGIESVTARSRAGLTVYDEQEQVKAHCNTYLKDAIDHLPGTSFQSAYSMCQGETNAFADSAWANGKSVLLDLKSIVSNVAGVDGRKILILAGAHLPEHPGREIRIWAVQQFQPYIQKLNMATAFGDSRAQTFSIKDTARFANANGVTFYMLDSADARDNTSAESAAMPDTTIDFMNFTDTAMAYKALADITGGAALTNTQNFDAAFETLDRDLSSFYSIGYKPQEGSKDDRKIAVRVKKPGLVVRARQSYTPKTPDQEMSDRLVANVFHHGAKGDWPIRLTAQAPQKDGDVYKLPVTVEMQPALTLLPQDDKMVGGFVLYIVVGTKAGGLSKVTRSPRKVELPAAGEAQFRAKPMTYTLMLSVRPGDNIVSVGVVDQVSNAAGFDRVDVAVR
jgi:VWFA-related protein